jgi:hypothetical protein
MMNRLAKHRLAAACLILTGLFQASCGVFDEETYHPPDGEGPWILVDLYHTRKQNHQDYRLSKGEYAYQGAFGFYRAFEHLHNNGYKSSSIRTMSLSAQRLEGFDVLFINLVDDNRPNFSQQERQNIRQWVQDGGGLFVIGDHTNVYRNADRLNPLLEPMGIEVGYHTATDQPPQYSVAGLAWIMVFDLDRHYLTRDVDMISLQTGAPVFGDYGIARLSDDGFADYWDETDTTGYYGNWRHDGDDTLEPRGKLPVVQAREYGQGRVVVAGDQNMFGDAWLHFGNNFELMMNTFQWLAGEETAAPLRAAPLAGLSIGLDMSHNSFQVGRNAPNGYYAFYVNLNRDHQVSADARMDIGSYNDVLMLMDPSAAFDDDDVERVRQYFADGKTVLVSFEADEISAATVGLLKQIAPNFSITIDQTNYNVSDGAERFEDLDVGRLQGPRTLDSGVLAVSDLDVSTLARSGQNEEQGLSPYLLAISSEWGDPFITTVNNGEDTVDIARRKAIGGGELIVFIQDGFWRNRTLGNSETTPPTPQNADAIELQYRLLDYLNQTSPE